MKLTKVTGIFLAQLMNDPKSYYAHFYWKKNHKVEYDDVSYQMCKYLNSIGHGKPKKKKSNLQKILGKNVCHEPKPLETNVPCSEEYDTSKCTYPDAN